MNDVKETDENWAACKGNILGLPVPFEPLPAVKMGTYLAAFLGGKRNICFDYGHYCLPGRGSVYVHGRNVLTVDLSCLSRVEKNEAARGKILKETMSEVRRFSFCFQICIMVHTPNAGTVWVLPFAGKIYAMPE